MAVGPGLPTPVARHLTRRTLLRTAIRQTQQVAAMADKAKAQGSESLAGIGWANQ
jgi:hypothetical protein